MDDIKLRIKEIIKESGLTLEEFARKIGTHQSSLSRALSEKHNIGEAMINKILIAFDINKNWLLTGQGKKEIMPYTFIETASSVVAEPQGFYETKSRTLKNDDTEPYLTKVGTKYFELPNGKFRMVVPFVPVRAYAGYADNCCDAEFVEKLEEREFTVDEIYHGRYYSFEIKGDSMTYLGRGSLYDGDVVLARELGKYHWKDELRINKYPVWVIVLKNTIICKQIINHDVEAGTITCHSLNTSPEYADFDLKLDNVLQLLNVVKKESDYSL